MMEHLSSYHHHPNHHNQHNVHSNVPPGAQHHRAQSTTAFDRSNNNNPTTSSFWANFLVNLSVNRRPTGRNGPGSGWGSPPSSPVFSMVTSAMDASGDIDHHNHYHRRLPIVSNQSSIGHHQRSLPLSQQDQCESESKPECSAATTSTAGIPHCGGGGSQLMVHSLNVTNIESRFRKSWGNFINIFDGQGRQKICITKHELTNYLQLQNYAHPQSPFTFYATLFAGNYPKPLYNASGTCWRMRYNVFVTGIVGPIGHSHHHHSSSDIGGTGPTGDGKTKKEEEEEEEGPDGTNTKPDPNKPSDQDNVVHLGELHIYFHVERGHLNPLYQNLCYFFDRSMLSLAGADLDNESELESVPGTDCPSMMSSSCPSSSKAQTSGSGCCPFSLWPVRAQLEQCARQLKLELSYSQFIQQFYFPIDKSRFRAADQSVDYFDLRQKDLRAAIRIVNDKVPFAFLHRAASLSRSCATISNAKQSSQPFKDSGRRNFAPTSSTTKLTTSSSSSSITSSQASLETTTTIEDEDEISPGSSTIGQMGVRNRMCLAGPSRVPNCGGTRNSHTRNAAKLL